MQRDLDKLFTRYQERGDVRALERVFDATARDLLILAQHLVRDADDAEDLVQSTFVAAIDRAASYDGTRPLRPWLAGILAHRAANLIRKRQARRASTHGLELETADPSSSSDPQLAAEAAELTRELEVALGHVGASYREVVDAYLRDDERPEQIARRLGRAPGTVRTQLYRGLEQLRRILPASALAGVLISQRGLGAVRGAVLRHATLHAGTPTTVGALSGGVLLGGSIVGLKAVVGGVAAIAVSAGLYVGMDDGAGLDLRGPVQPLAEEHQDELVLRDLVSSDSRSRSAGSASSLSEVEVRGQAEERQALSQGRALLRGQVTQVRPEHFDGLHFSLTRVRTDSSSAADSRLASQGFGQSVLSFDEPNNLLSAYTRTLDVLELPVVQSAVQSGTLPAQVQGASLRLQNPIAPDQFLTKRVEQLDLGEVEVQPDGSFEIDMTSFVNSKVLGFELSLGHEVYFEESLPFEFNQDVAELIAAGGEEVQSLQFAPSPAAVVRGKVELMEAEAPQLATDPYDLQVADEYATIVMDRINVAVALQAQTSYLVQSEEIDGSTFRIVLFSPHSGTHVALFRPGGTQPLVTQQLDVSGEFELRSPEGGDFILVVYEAERALANFPVDLRLEEVESLEEDLIVAEGPRIRGLTQDFGLFPQGGLTVVAERLQGEEDVQVNWLEQNMVWSHGELCLQRSSAETDERGRFELLGFSRGTHRLQFEVKGAVSVFGAAEIAREAVESPAPADGVVLRLPATIIDVECSREPREDADGEPIPWTVRIEDGTSPVDAPEVLGELTLDGEGRGSVLARPLSELRLMLVAPDGMIELWSGTTGAIGARTLAR